MTNLSQLTDEQHYEIQIDSIMTGYGPLLKGQVFDGLTLKAIMKDVKQDLHGAFKETNKSLTRIN